MTPLANDRGVARRAGSLLARVLGQRDTWLPMLVLAVPALAWLALAGRAYPTLEPYQTGDYAKIELYTRLAAEGSQRIGTESRFHVHHPGPSFFYAAAPIYFLLGQTTTGMAAAALVWNLVFLVALLRSAGRLAPRDGPFVAALVLGVLIQARGLGFLLSPWNPHVAMLPFGVALLASARLATGEGQLLPLLALAGSVVVQNHVAWGLPLALATGVGPILCVWSAARRRLGIPTHGPGLTLRGTTLALVVLALLWVLPVVDELTGSYHNLRRIVATSGGGAPRSWSDALLPAVRGLGLRLDGSQPASIIEGTGQRRPELRPAALEWKTDRAAADVARTALLFGALAVAGWLAARRRAATAALALTAAAGGLAIPVLIRLLPGRALPTYLFQWGAMVTLAAMLVVGGEILARVPRLGALASGWAGRALLLLVPVVLLTSAVRARPTPPLARDSRSVEIERLTQEIETRSRTDVPGRRFLLRVAPHEDQAVVVGLILALDKAGLRFAVEPFGSCRIEGRFTPRGDEWAELLIGDLPAGEGARPLGPSSLFSVVWRLPWRTGGPRSL